MKTTNQPEVNEASDVTPVSGSLLKQKKARRKCYNCKFAGKQFKVSGVTHLHCEDENQYPKEKWVSGELTAWDSLQKFSDSCKNHEFKKPKYKNENTNRISRNA